MSKISFLKMLRNSTIFGGFEVNSVCEKDRKRFICKSSKFDILQNSKIAFFIPISTRFSYNLKYFTK